MSPRVAAIARYSKSPEHTVAVHTQLTGKFSVGEQSASRADAVTARD
jgi:hypothetical protein